MELKAFKKFRSDLDFLSAEDPLRRLALDTLSRSTAVSSSCKGWGWAVAWQSRLTISQINGNLGIDVRVHLHLESKEKDGELRKLSDDPKKINIAAYDAIAVESFYGANLILGQKGMEELHI